jgi:glycosyltransferase involved in cell wall biosynthesis
VKVSLAILTWNEIVGLKALFEKIPFEVMSEVFAVDGGSSDGTIEFLREKNITTFIQSQRGRGDAFRLAFEKAKGDAIIFFGPDGNENPRDIPRFLEYLEQGSDIVIASRMVSGAHNEEDDQVLKWRKWSNLAFNQIANRIWNRGTFVTDSINGFRAVTRNAWERMAPDGAAYTIEYQMTIRAFKLGLKISEFPTYEGGRIDQRDGSPSIRTGLAFIGIFLSEIFSGASRQKNNR